MKENTAQTKPWLTTLYDSGTFLFLKSGEEVPYLTFS